MHLKPTCLTVCLLAVSCLLVSTSGCANRGAEGQDVAVGAVDQPIGGSIAVGAPCKIQLRRDALGGTMNLPISPTTDSINGASVSVSGKLVSMDGKWVVIEGAGKKEFWVPRSMVLLIQVSK